LQGLFLHARLNLLSEVLASRKHPSMIALADVTSKVIAFVSHRNFIAHNGLSINVYKSSDGKLMLEEAIVSARDRKKSISLKQLMALADQARDLETEFESAAMDVVREFFDAEGNECSPPNGLND
jgi:hypothetical protein